MNTSNKKNENILDTISNIRKDSKEEGDIFSHMVVCLEEFRTLTGVSKYFTDDAELYYELSCFSASLEALKELVNQDLVISNIHGEDLGDYWTIDFDINNSPTSIILFINGNQDLIGDFIDQLNNQITLCTNIKKKFRFVMTASSKYSDEYFELCFIDDEVFDILKNNSPRYAYDY